MGTLSEIGANAGDIVFRISAEKKRWRRLESVPLDTPRATIHVEAIEVLEGIKFGGGIKENRLLLVASTRSKDRIGVVEYDPGYNSFVGGSGEETHEVLEKRGVAPRLERNSDGDVIGVFLAKKSTS